MIEKKKKKKMRFEGDGETTRRGKVVTPEEETKETSKRGSHGSLLTDTEPKTPKRKGTRPPWSPPGPAGAGREKGEKTVPNAAKTDELHTMKPLRS